MEEPERQSTEGERLAELLKMAEAVEQLTRYDEWAVFQAAIENRLDALRGELEMPMSHEETENHRGAIRELRDVLRIPERLVQIVKEQRLLAEHSARVNGEESAGTQAP